MSSFDVMKIRADFPALTQRPHGKHLVYLDSAATALKPWPVIERIGHFYTYETANVHRGAHYLADQATGFFEQSREAARAFLGAESTDEIIFTKGTTDSINLVAASYGRNFLNEGDEIVLSEMEHHANIVPWQMLAKEKNLNIRWLPVDAQGELDLSDLDGLFGPRTKIFAVTHCSNTLGTINNLKPLIERAHKVGAVVLVDGAQMVANNAVNVLDLDADFYAFSGHKLFGPYGVGVLYGKRALLEKMPPYQGGGSMISQVTCASVSFNDIPFKFEAGTPNIESVIALKSAIDYVQKIGFENISAHEDHLLKLALSRLSEIPEVQFFGSAKQRAPIISFNLAGIHASDVGQVLDQDSVAVRVGHHCTQPLLKKFGLNATVRASFSIFNTEKDIDALINGLKKAKELLL